MPRTGRVGPRDREHTKQRLIEATLDLLREKGFAEVGVNAVAQRAGVSKVLIYRYFGDFSGLLGAVAEYLDPLQARAADRLLGETPDGATAGAVMHEVVMGLHNALSRDELTKQLLVWELTKQSDVTAEFSAARERIGLGLTQRFAELLRSKDVPEEVDLHALFALVTAAVSYLTLRSDAVQFYNGLDIQSEEGWERLASLISTLIDAQSS